MSCLLRRCRLVGRVGLVGLAGTIFAVAPVPAAESKEVARPLGLGETVEVQVVNVETVVTDKSGRQISGLDAGDFRLFVDGEKVDIGYFSEVVEEVADTAGTNYLVFIDEFFTIAVDRVRVLRRLQEQLSVLGPNDRMALVAWNGRTLEMLSSWDGDAANLEKALDTAIARPSLGLQRVSELRLFELTRRQLAPIRSSFRGGPYALDHLETDELEYVARLYDQLKSAVAAASSTMRGFSRPEGRKVMMLLAGPWPERPVHWAIPNPARPVIEPQYEGRASLYSPMIETANLLDYTLYPVDVEGISVGSGTGVDAVGGPRAGAATSYDRSYYREQEVHWGLGFLAHQTGGLALLNGERDRSLELVHADTRSFYSIGFAPNREGDGQRHEVRLEVVVDKMKLRNRRSFTDFSKSEEVTMQVESALLFGNPGTALPLGVVLGTGEKSGRGKLEIPLTVELPMSALTLLRTGSEWVGQLELRVASMDDAGNRSDIPVIPIEVREDRAPVEGDRFTYETTLRMRKRDQDIVVALYDTASGEIWAEEVRLLR